MVFAGIASRLGLTSARAVGSRVGSRVGTQSLSQFGSRFASRTSSLWEVATANPLRAVGTGLIGGQILSDIPVVGSLVPGSSEEESLAVGAVVVVAAVGAALIGWQMLE